MQKARNTGIDMAKILAMLMVCVLHYVGKGGLLTDEGSTWFYIGSFLKSFAIVAVNVYMLASGYLLHSRPFKKSRIIQVWTQTVFWSWLIFGIMTAAVGFGGYGAAAKSLLPVIAMEYWYVTAYVIVLLLTPFLNAGIAAMSRKSAYGTAVVLLAVLSLWKTLFPQNGLLEIGYMQGYGVIWMAALYVIGGILGKYPPTVRHKTWLLVGYLAGGALIFAMDCLCVKLPKLSPFHTFFDYNNIVVALSSICFFLYCSRLSLGERSGRVLSRIAGHTLAVYVIQEQFILKGYLWKALSDLAQRFSLGVALICSAAGILLIFGGCVLLDMARKELFDRLKLNRRLESLMDRVMAVVVKK